MSLLRLFQRVFENLRTARGWATRRSGRIGNLEQLESRCVLSGMLGGPHFHEGFHAPPPDFGGSMFTGPPAVHGGPPRGGPGSDFHPPGGFLPPPPPHGPSMAEGEFAPSTRDTSAPRAGGPRANSELPSAPLSGGSLPLSPMSAGLLSEPRSETALTAPLFGDSEFLETALATSESDAADTWATIRALDRPLQHTVDEDEPDAGEDADQRKAGDLSGQSVNDRESTELDPFASSRRDKNKSATKRSVALLASAEPDRTRLHEAIQDDRSRIHWRSADDEHAPATQNRQPPPQPEDGLVELPVADSAELAAIRAPAQPEVIHTAPPELGPEAPMEPALELYQAVEVNLSAPPVVEPRPE